MLAVAAPFADARRLVFGGIARSIEPRKSRLVSEWAEGNLELSSKVTAAPGKFRVARNPLLREIMDTQSVRAGIEETIAKLPIQFGKSTIEQAVLGYAMCEDPGPIMVCLPGEVSLDKFTNQKLNPLLENTAAVREVLGSTSSRDAANTKTFKDFAGGQLYMEHAGNPKRLKSTTVKRLLIDEWSSFASSLPSGDDPGALVKGRVSAYPYLAKVLKVGTPEIAGACRVTSDFEESDQRHAHVPCPHCGHYQALFWKGLHWDLHPVTGRVLRAWYVCGGDDGCGAVIEEHHKPGMIEQHRWVPHNPDGIKRGYTANCLYYARGLGPGWVVLAQEWLDAQGDPAKLKTFINDRLAEAWVDPALARMAQSALQDRAEPYPLRTAPFDVCYVTVGVDTQDDRLEAHFVGWAYGRGGMRGWTLDYVVLPGNPANQQVWDDLTELLLRPIAHASGASIPVSAVAIDGRGHRTKFVKAWCARAEVPRPMCIFGAKAANAPVLGRPKYEELRADGKVDRDGIQTWPVGTIEIKHHLFRRLGSDSALDAADRCYHFPDALEKPFFLGMTSEVFDPRTGRYVKKRGSVRNEPLDTWGYAYAAAHHPELHLHRLTAEEWRRAHARIVATAPAQAELPSPDLSESAARGSSIPARQAPPVTAQPSRRRAASSYLRR
ncbi:MAG: phage terminase large subunit family protein [Candidatus Dactylopiibacterium sp.]|nr:phage terminase large subunit family protein [Candidatus Dactylopiibacterium sp.]